MEALGTFWVRTSGAMDSVTCPPGISFMAAPATMLTISPQHIGVVGVNALESLTGTQLDLRTHANRHAMP